MMRAISIDFDTAVDTRRDMEAALQKFRTVRRQSEVLCEPLLKEDYNLQAMPEVSPPKWHLAHTTWFFEEMLLKEFESDYKPHHPLFGELFNSYYLQVGAPYPRDRRGLLSRPPIADIYEYRHCIEERVRKLLASAARAPLQKIMQRLELGLNHEQQHQELLLTDIKYNLSVNPLKPAYCDIDPPPGGMRTLVKPLAWIDFPARIAHIGADAAAGFHFDNEVPRHRYFLAAYALADRLVTNGEYLEFINDGGYLRSELWLSDGWQSVQANRWQMPLYWSESHGKFCNYTLHGMRPLNYGEPVCHISYYEADAYARWAGARLPTEMEWENAAATLKVEGHFVCDGILHPRHSDGEGLRQMYGDVWEWTGSSYAPYPGYAAAPGAIGEYNGKFMSSQMVLRGGSCVSEREHIRCSYRNFFYPHDRWQFSGVRLARAC